VQTTVPERKSLADDLTFFKDLFDEVVNAWHAQDASKAAPFYSQEPNLNFFDFAPLKFTGWKEYADGVQRMFFDNMPPNSSGFQLSNDFQVKRFGNGAVTNATFHFWAKMKDGSKIENDGRVTTVWEKSGDKWLIVHDHWSFPFSPK